MANVTQLLEAIQSGQQQAAEELLPLVYDELRKLARQKLANEKPGHTLQATALVHEAYLRLVNREGEAPAEPSDLGHSSLNPGYPLGARTLNPSFDSRGHFFA